jgi:hypothetical protein
VVQNLQKLNMQYENAMRPGANPEAGQAQEEEMQPWEEGQKMQAPEEQMMPGSTEEIGNEAMPLEGMEIGGAV